MLKEDFEPIPGFRLERFLGRGQFGEVWKATSPGGTHVALKFLNVRERQGRKEFRSVQKIKGIRHPHLVQTYALWLLDEDMRVIDDDAAFDPSQSLMMDTADKARATLLSPVAKERTHRKPSMLVIATVLCDQNLMERLRECQAANQTGVPIDELLGYMEDAAKAIDFLNAPRHDLGDGPTSIHHCDIKPENLMIVGDRAVVGDFGVARILRSGGSVAKETSMGGSVAYMPPESFDSRTEFSSDQYALAITYYELRTGKLPFVGDSVAQVMKAKIDGTITFAEVSPAESKVLLKATSVQPDKRFATARAFVDALQSATTSKSREGQSWGWVWAGFGALAGVLLLAFGFVLFSDRLREESSSIENRNSSIDKNGFSGIEGELLWKQAIHDYRIAEQTDQAFDATLKKLVLAVKQSTFRPILVEPLGVDFSQVQNLASGKSFDPLAPDKKIAISQDGRILSKVTDNKVQRIFLDTGTTDQLTMDKLSEIEQCTWFDDQLVLIDDTFRVYLLDGSNLDIEAVKDSLTEIVGGAVGNESRWLNVLGNVQAMLLINATPERKVGAFGAVAPGLYRIFRLDQNQNLEIVPPNQKLRWQDTKWRQVHLESDSTGDFWSIFNTYEDSHSNLVIYDYQRHLSFDLSDDPILEKISELESLTFTDKGDSFVVVGNGNPSSDANSILGFGQYINDQWKIIQLTLPIASESIGCVRAISKTEFLIGQGVKLWKYQNLGSDENWTREAVADFEAFGDGKAIRAINELDNKWLILGHESGETSVCLIAAEDQSDPMMICTKINSTIRRIFLAGDKQNRLVIVAEDGSVAWFDADEVRLTAAACEQAEVKPIAATEVVSNSL